MVGGPPNRTEGAGNRDVAVEARRGVAVYKITLPKFILCNKVFDNSYWAFLILHSAANHEDVLQSNISLRATLPDITRIQLMHYQS